MPLQSYIFRNPTHRLAGPAPSATCTADRLESRASLLRTRHRFCFAACRVLLGLRCVLYTFNARFDVFEGYVFERKGLRYLVLWASLRLVMTQHLVSEANIKVVRRDVDWDVPLSLLMSCSQPFWRRPCSLGFCVSLMRKGWGEIVAPVLCEHIVFYEEWLIWSLILFNHMYPGAPMGSDDISRDVRPHWCEWGFA